MSNPETRDQNDEPNGSEEAKPSSEPETEYDELVDLAPKSVPVDGPAPLP